MSYLIQIEYGKKKGVFYNTGKLMNSKREATRTLRRWKKNKPSTVKSYRMLTVEVQ